MSGKMISLLVAAVSAVSHAGSSSLSGELMVVPTCSLMVGAAAASFQFAFVALAAHTIIWTIRRWKLDDGKWRLELIFQILRILFALAAIVMALAFFSVPFLICGSWECGNIGSSGCLN